MSGTFGETLRWQFIALFSATFILEIFSVVQCYRLKNSGRYLFLTTGAALLILNMVSGAVISIGFLTPLDLIVDGTWAVLFYVMFCTDLKEKFQ